MSNTTTQTDANGQTTNTLNGVVVTSTDNAVATVTAATAAGSNTHDVTVRTVLLAGGKYYWTMTSDHNTSVLATAQSNCAAFGGGRVFEESDIAIFLAAGGDYQSKSVPGGEYSNNWFRLGDKWTTKSVDLFDNAGSGGATNPRAGVEYTCVK
jgi:adhesin/invasin